MEFGKVTLEKQGHIAIITMNNPNALNALSSPFMADISAAVDAVEADRDIFVTIITGVNFINKKGKPTSTFIAGADIKQMLDLTPVSTIEWAEEGNKLNYRIEHMRGPVIAAVNGFCLGGGNELAMACDIRIASEKATFGQPEVGLGITPGAGGTQRLPRLIGTGKAKELLYTGRVIKAEEAEKIGLVDKVVPADELMDSALALANEILANSQVAVQQVKKCINYGMQTDMETARQFERQAFAVCNGSEDKHIGMGAFVNHEKEKHFVYR